MRLPPYGRALFDRRMDGARPRVAQLLVGNFWKSPKWMPAGVPRVAVKTAAWDDAATERFEWRAIAGMTVLAVDVRGPDERAVTDDGWDPWLWLLADVQQYAAEVLMITPMVPFVDLRDRLAAERELDMFAWLSREWDNATSTWSWPRWWPYGDRLAAAA